MNGGLLQVFSPSYSSLLQYFCPGISCFLCITVILQFSYGDESMKQLNVWSDSPGWPPGVDNQSPTGVRVEVLFCECVPSCAHTSAANLKRVAALSSICILKRPRLYWTSRTGSKRTTSAWSPVALQSELH